jgi:hypothetical protein
MRKLVLSLAVFAVAAFAADIDGTWKAETKTPDGQARTSTFVLKADGNKLTGTVQGMRGDPGPIENGKIDGNKFSFNVVRKTQNGEFKMAYKGTVSGAELKLSATMNMGGEERTFDMVAKKQ